MDRGSHRARSSRTSATLTVGQLTTTTVMMELQDQCYTDRGPAEDHHRDDGDATRRSSGEGLLKTYLVQVQLVASFNTWSAEETGVQVVLALEGKALQVLVDLQPIDASQLSGYQGGVPTQP